MERKLISSNYSLAKLTFPGLIPVMVLLQVHYSDKLRWPETLVMAILELLFCVGTWWFYTLKHPVYFDDTYFYWGKPVGEGSAPIASIKSILYNYDLGSKLVWIKYTDADNNIKTLRFYVTYSWRKPYTAMQGMKEFESYVKEKNTAVEFKRPWT